MVTAVVARAIPIGKMIEKILGTVHPQHPLAPLDNWKPFCHHKKIIEISIKTTNIGCCHSLLSTQKVDRYGTVASPA